MIQVTERAAQRIKQLLAKEQMPPSAGLRLGVQGGGCSGMSYVIRLDPRPREKDAVLEVEGARVFVDPKSLLYLDGTVFDFKGDVFNQQFVFENPNAKKSCSCGASFSA
ncbi:iron-sulfur cluster assembly accessory protein [Acidobacteriia bacterium AH_259_A11_L15]|nr:iron-sulfur cluster assembly accessory protein [Acidobacteriia bacterium AH_259_A11_L15]